MIEAMEYTINSIMMCIAALCGFILLVVVNWLIVKVKRWKKQK